MSAALSRSAGAPELWLRKTRRKFDVLSLKAFDTTTEDGRAKERHRRIALTALAAILAKIVSVASMMVSVPLTLHYLGQERFGLWMVINSLTLLLSFSDLGLGNGVLNALAKANGEDDRVAQRTIISNGYAALTLIASVLAILAMALFPIVDWARAFNVSSPLAVAEARPAICVYAAFFIVGVPLALVQRIQAGRQQGFASSLWQCGSSLLGLACVMAAIAARSGLPILVAALVGAPQIANLFNTVLLFWREPDLIPMLRLVRLAGVRRLAQTALLFLVYQVGVAAVSGADALIIAQALGAGAVAAYAVPERLFGLITMLLNMALSPLWPAYGEAAARGDRAWISRTFKYSLLIAVLASVGAAAAVLGVGKYVIHLWVGRDFAVSFGLLVALAGWKICEGTGTPVAALLNGMNKIKAQAAIMSISAILCCTIKYKFATMFGLVGVPLASVVGYGLVALPLQMKIARDIVKP